MGAIIDVDATGHLNMSGYDMGKGTLVARLIRKRINCSRLDSCAETLVKRGNYNVWMRYFKQMSKILDGFNYSFSAEEKRVIMRKAGVMTESAFLEISCDNQIGDIWLLFHSGAEELSKLIASVGPSYYLNQTLQMEDFQNIQRFAAFSRKMAIHRLFQVYYGTAKFDEAALQIMDFPYHTVQPEKSRLYLAAQPTKDWSLFLSNVKDGAILYQPNMQQAKRIGLSGCGKLDPVEDEFGSIIEPEPLGISMFGIHYCNKEVYNKVRPSLYQPVQTALATKGKKIILRPIYNYRIGN